METAIISTFQQITNKQLDLESEFLPKLTYFPGLWHNFFSFDLQLFFNKIFYTLTVLELNQD